MPKLSQLGGQLVRCVAEIGEDVTIVLKVSPQGITPEVIERLYENGSMTEEDVADMSQQDQIAALNTMVKYILVAVKEWDLTNDDDTPFPLTEEAVKKIPMLALGKIMEAISEAVTVSKQNATS